MRLRISFLWLFVAISLCRAQTFEFRGPYGGDVRSLAISPHAPESLLIGTSDGQIFRSQDAGQQWERTMGLGRGAVVDNLVFDPNVSGRTWAAAWDIRSNSGGLFRSDDGGTSWVAVPISPQGISIRALAVAPSDSGTLLVGTLDGVYLSRDEGKSWSLISQGERDLVNIESVAVDPKNTNTFFAGTWHLGAKSTDGGRTWKWIKRGMSDDSDLFSVAIHPNAPHVVYASTCSGIYKSTNGGHLWVRLRNGLPAEAQRTRTIYLDPVNPDHLFAGTTQGLFVSRDAGRSWSRVSSPDLTINAIAVNPRSSNEVYLATDDAGVLKSEDGGKTFYQTNHGFTHRQIAQIVGDPASKEGLYASVLFDRTYGGFFISDDGGKSWRQSNRGIRASDVDIYSILPGRDGRIYLGTSAGIYLSRDRGENWSKLTPVAGPGHLKLFQSKVLQLQFLSTTEQRIAAATVDGFYLGDLKSGNWSRAPFPQYNGAVSMLLPIPETNIVFAGSGIGLFISRNGGKTWKLSGEGLPMTAIRSLETLPRGKVSLAGTSYGLYRSLDDGETWSRVQGIPPIDISALRRAHDGNSIYAGDFVHGNVYVSYDSGANWQALTRGTNSGVSSLMVDPRDDSKLFLGSLSDGISALHLRPMAEASLARPR